ncbi:MAG: energy-coupling factor ABC transporter permease [Thiotrichales bacterium]|nr:energy-coupling factor ABC transporter permease [Thiotrichales bacterium]
MNLSAEGLGLPSLLLGWLSLLAMLGWSLRTAPWFKVTRDRSAQHIWLFISVVVFLAWQLSASLGNGISFHFLLMTLMTLMFGVQFAFLGMLLALIGLTLFSQLGLWALGINALIMGIVPIMMSQGMLMLSRRFLEQNFFVYVLFNGFLAAGISMVAALLLGGIVLGLNQVYGFEYLSTHFFPFIPLMAIPEGFVNGMLLAAIVVMKPHWLSSFQDRDFINGK